MKDKYDHPAAHWVIQDDLPWIQLTLPLNKKVKPRKRRAWNMRAKKFSLWGKTQVCHYCMKLLSFETATMDHITPLSKGGSNRLDNLVLACQPCNQKKGDSTGWEDIVQRGKARDIKS